MDAPARCSILEKHIAAQEPRAKTHVLGPRDFFRANPAPTKHHYFAPPSKTAKRVFNKPLAQKEERDKQTYIYVGE